MSAQYCLEVKRLENLQWKRLFHSKIPGLYAEVKLGADIKRTRTIKKNKTPAWNEHMIFHPSDVSDMFSIRILHDSKWLPDPCLGTVDISIADLFKASDSGEERPGTIIMELVMIDAIPAADVMIDKAGNDVQESGIARSEQISDLIDARNDRIIHANTGNDLYQAVGQLLSRLDALTRVISVLSGVHPYLTIAWSLSTGLMKIVKHVFEIDEKLVGLVSIMRDAYAFTCDILSFPDKATRLENSITGLVKQTIECCIFIGQYTRRSFVGRMFDTTSSDKINDFERSLVGFKTEIETGVNLHTVFVSVRISREIDEILLRQRLEPSQTDTSNRSVCLTGTRTEILQEITHWMFSDTDQNILWLHGVAGSGKSTVSMTIAEYLRGLSRLGGLLMFQRGKSEPSTVIRTIAFKLAQFDSTIGPRIITDISGDKDIITATLATQFDKLLLQPLAAVSDSLPGPVAFVLDALDECGSPDSRRGLLQLLRHEFPRLPKNFRFLITSRPEPEISRAFSPQDKAVYAMELDYMSTTSHDDVQSYLSVEMSKIMAEQIGPKAAEKWNWDKSVGLLGKAVGGLFIFASTAVKMISASDNPFSALEELVSNTSSAVHFGLDELYSTVLRHSGIVWDNEKSKTRFANVLALVLLSQKPLSSEAIDGILGFSPLESSLLVLSRLRCLLSYSPGAPVSLFHASFHDYLTSPERTKDPWYIDISAHQQFITSRCFIFMQDMLHFNMCSLESSFVRNEDVPGLANRVECLIPAHLEYACFYWISHLCDSQHSPDLVDKLSSFAYERLLFWFETLNLKTMFRRIASRALVDAATWVQAWNADLSLFLEESSRLAFDFGVPIVQSTPHIYMSMIPLTKDESIVSAHYMKRIFNLVHVEWHGIRRPSACVKVLEGHSWFVTSVDVSPRGTCIASASTDETVRVWDIVSGEEVLTLAHNSGVNSVSFSPDGSRLASGCDDGTLRLWDVSEGTLIRGLERHTGNVSCVAYSPDGTRIASGSSDGTFIICDAFSGGVVAGPFESRLGMIRSVAFSVDGTQVASGTEGGTWTILLWDVATGELVLEPLIHPRILYSVVFCPTGEYIASCCGDEKVRIWDKKNGNLVSALSCETTGRFSCVAYSPCGTRIISGSLDNTITAWDANNGDVVSILRGHSGRIDSVGFTPDGRNIVSGSDDKTVRIWDADPRQVDHKDDVHHTWGVSSVAFSPCGRWIASASGDTTIIIWNARTGEAVMDPLRGHTERVTNVIFSSDGSQLVSGSDDKTVRIWDIESGKPVGEPLERHTGEVLCFALSPDGVQIASGSIDGTIKVWNMPQRQLVAGPLRVHFKPIESIAFSSDGKQLASGSRDKTIRLRDTRTWETISEPFTCHEDSVVSVCFSPNNTRIASSSSDDTVLVWDAETRQILAGPFKVHLSWPRCVIFLPDGLHLAASYTDHTIRVWDVESEQAVSLRGHSDNVSSLALSLDGTRIASGSWDKTVRVWDMSAIFRLAQKRRSTARSVSASLEQEFLDWVLEDNGWILGGPDGHDLLCWIPPDLRRSVWSPLNTAVCREFSTELDFTAAALGRRWTECFAIRS